MKIRQYIKRMATLALMVALLAPLQDAWGQEAQEPEYVTGDRYNSTSVVKVSGVTVSNDPTEDKKNPISNAIDGNEDSNWKSGSSTDDEEVIFNVGDNYGDIRTIELYVKEEKRRANTVIIEYSSDGNSNWNNITTIYNFYNSERHSISLNGLGGRYVKLTFTKRSGKDYKQVNLNEIYFYAAGVDLSKISVQHKPAKWYDLRKTLQINNAADNFDEDESLSMNIAYDGVTKIQAAHTLIDTIYVHKGTKVTLTLPDYLKGTTNNKTYQRWYNYLTESTFATGNTEEGAIVDYLTPGTAVSGNAANGIGYRFANGYIGQPLSSACLYVMDFYVPESGYQNWYLVACDVSGYTDFTEDFTSDSKNSSFADGYWEPTLSHRFIYFIRVIEDNTSWAAQQINAGKPIEEKDITMPATRLPDYTDEMVALSMDARSYLTPTGDQNEANGNLTVRLDNNTAGITLQTESLSGENRVIFINYPKTNLDNTQSVNSTNDGSDPKATVNVYRGSSTLVARYNLTFKEESRLLTQTQVSQENAKENSPYGYRMPNYLNENYELLTELNFDFDDAVANQYGLPQCYPFPLGWNSSTYGFYDGGVAAGDFTGPTGSRCPEWGYYGLLNSYVECKDKKGFNWGWTGYTYNAPNDADPIRYNSKGNPSTYHLYADVSDRPGVIARLPFDRKLCPGTELFVTAWVKCARGDASANNAAALFSIMGVKNSTVGTSSRKDYTPIFRYQTGQIPATYRNDGKLANKVPGFVEQNGTTGGNNDWLQVYFSFINTNNDDFDSYVLQIDNNSASTNGGDIYIDDIRVYVMSPNAKVSQLEATCTNDRTLTNIELDWDQLMSRLGHDETQKGEDAIDFCFIDKTRYNNYLAEHPSDYEGAVKASVIEVGNNEDPEQGGYNGMYHTLYFKMPFTDNTEYVTGKENLAVKNMTNGKAYFYRHTDEAGVRSLSVDFYSALTPNRPYILLINNHDPSDEALDAGDFSYNIDDACVIKTEFYVTAQNLIRVNGEVVDPSTDFCAGQVFSFSASLRVPTGVNEEDGTTIYTEIKEGVYFDWFFGTEDEYTRVNTMYGVSLLEALTAFRNIYTDNVDLTGIPAEGYGEFTKDMYNLIKFYLEQPGEDGGQHAPLILHKENLDITLLNSGLQLVVQPIRTLVPPGGITEDIWTAVCWSYIPLVLNASGNAPQLHAGFNYVTYPTEDFNPGLRIGLDQIKSTSETHPLVVNLRGAEVVTEGAVSIGMITSVNQDTYNKIYLVGTDDPEYNNETYFPVDFGQYSLPIGTLKSLSAWPYQSGSPYDDKMEIYFDLDDGDENEENGFNFQPKEGYTYTFAVHFEEKMDNSSSGISNACFGSFTIDMKVVPMYLEWNDVQKDDPNQPVEVTIGNWNYDGNWKRIASTDINAATDGNSDYFTDGNNKTDNGFVPMLFSKVIIPKDSKVELYAAGANGPNWVSYRPSHIAAISDSIQYDLMAYKHPSDDQTFPGQLKTERYRVSLLDEIHFEPGAEMLHAEYLLYKKAWVDYQLGKGHWYTLASPLKDVVAGDFYSDSDSGKEMQEYFTDITFAGNGLYNNGTLPNNRFSPSVYQRAWKGESTEVPLYTDATNTKNVAISGNWSALYNKVDEAYTPGTGFSLKVQDLPVNSQTALFRLPKADMEYYYYSQDGTEPDEDDKVGNISKDNAHRLKSDELYVRNIDINASGQKKDPIKISLTESATKDYYLVGNPFMAHLDMDAFLKGNNEVIEPKYWAVDDGVQDVAVVNPDTDEGWITQDNATTIAPLQSFFVKKKKEEAGSNEIKFTQEMQTLGGADGGLRSANALTITATTSDGRTSRAAVAYSGMATDDYQSSEDAELFLDSNLGDVPMVYTVAGTMASSINVRQNCELVPLGVYGARNEQVTLRFDQVGVFSGVKLYDTKTKSYTTLTDGSEVSVSTNDYGRYYLTGGIATGNEAIRSVDDISIYSVRSGEIVATSAGSSLRSVRVYGIGGELVTQQSLANQSVYRLRVPGNAIYVVYAEDMDGIIRNVKLRVR